MVRTPKDERQGEAQVQVITTEQLMMHKVDQLTELMLKGFEELGVDLNKLGVKKE